MDAANYAANDDDGLEPVALDVARALPLVSPGLVVISSRALELLCTRSVNPAHIVRRHVAGAWNDLGESDRVAKLASLREGRITEGVFALPGPPRTWVHVVSDGSRDLTYIVLPSEAKLLL